MGPKSYTYSTAPTVDDHVQAQPERSYRECLTNGYVEQFGTSGSDHLRENARRIDP